MRMGGGGGREDVDGVGRDDVNRKMHFCYGFE